MLCTTPMDYITIAYSRRKHIEVHYHFIRDHVEKGDVYLRRDPFLGTNYVLELL